MNHPNQHNIRIPTTRDGLVSADIHGVPFIRVDLNLPPGKRWLDAGEQYREAITCIAGDGWDEVMALVNTAPNRFPRGSHLHKLLRLLTPAMRKMPTALGALGSYVARMLGGEYAAEIRGLAKGANLHPGQLFFLNLSYDLCQVGGYMGQACSSASFIDQDGSPVLARNLDWNLPESVGEHTVVIEFNGRNGSYHSVGVLGFVGVLSAIRAQHWALTLNQAPCNRSMISPFAMPACMLVRYACDHSRSYTRLKDTLQKWVPQSPFLTHLVGTSKNQQHLIQHAGSFTYEIAAENGRLAQTNHYLDHTWGDEINRDCGWLEGDFCERHQLLERRLGTMSLRTPADGFKLLGGDTLTYSATQQQMVFHPKTGSIALRVRPSR